MHSSLFLFSFFATQHINITSQTHLLYRIVSAKSTDQSPVIRRTSLKKKTTPCPLEFGRSISHCRNRATLVIRNPYNCTYTLCSKTEPPTGYAKVSCSEIDKLDPYSFQRPWLGNDASTPAQQRSKEDWSVAFGGRGRGAAIKQAKPAWGFL